MQQIFQNQRSGSFRLDDVPAPACRADGVLVAVRASLISSGTERRKAELGGKSLLEKARARPDLIAQVVDRARVEGLSETVNLVRERLDAPQPLGYSAAGTVVEAGPLVTGLAVGQPVAIAGAGFANHAEVCSVPANLAAPVPDGVDPGHACFATVGAIALQGIRQAAATPGEIVAVIGLGLVGHLTDCSTRTATRWSASTSRRRRSGARTRCRSPAAGHRTIPRYRPASPSSHTGVASTPSS
jgi:threonine dehydrogenase-like Zn-dependent dehydrogenase